MGVILYSTGCPKCIVLGKKLEMKGIQYEVCNDIDVMTGKGFMSVPMLEVGGEVKDFMSAINWVNNY